MEQTDYDQVDMKYDSSRIRGTHEGLKTILALWNQGLGVIIGKWIRFYKIIQEKGLIDTWNNNEGQEGLLIVQIGLYLFCISHKRKS